MLKNKVSQNVDFRSNEITNSASNIVKILGRSLWSLFLPSLLSVSDFSFYGSIQYYGSTLISSSNLGTQQVIFRSSNQKIPFLSFIIHSFTLVTLQCLLLKIFFSNTSLHIIIYSLLFTFFTICYYNITTLLKSHRQFKITLNAEIYAALFFIFSILVLLFFPSLRPKAVLLELGVYAVTILFCIFRFHKFDCETLLKTKGFLFYARSIYKVGYMTILDGILWKLIPIYFINQKCTNIEKAVYLLTILIGNAATLIPLSFVESWTSEFADTYRKSMDNFLTIFSTKKKKIGYTILILIPISVLGLSILMNTLYVKYISFLWVIILFVPLRIIVSFFDVHSAALYATHNENKLILPSTSGALILIILSLFFSLHFGLVGILASYIISKFCMGLLTYRAFSKTFGVVHSKP